MIIIKELKFSNWFSYGKDNHIDFEKETLTQIKGKNGDGKSSIALILQELYYGKNIKGIKKQELLNRNCPKEKLWAWTKFTSGSDIYEIELTRRATLKLILKKNGVDISSHTSTNTYKSIESILGMDFKTFTQLTYQSSISSLQFLTATDTTRKTFLISLFNLEKYTDMFNIFKEEVKNGIKDISKKEGSIDTISSWVNSHEKMDLSLKEEVLVPEQNDSLGKEITSLKLELSNLSETNKKINSNNEYIKMRNSLKIEEITKVPDNREDYENDIVIIKEQIADYNVKLRVDKSSLDALVVKLNKYEKIPDKCITCNQPWPEEKNEEKIKSIKAEIKTIKAVMETTTKERDVLENQKESSQFVIWAIEKDLKKFEEAQKRKEEFEMLTALIDNTLPTEISNATEIQASIDETTLKVQQLEKEIDEAVKYNSIVTAQNSKIKVIKEQLAEYENNLSEEVEELSILEYTQDKLDILKKAFSSTGLITYKLEFLIKDLENEINKYLVSFSDGQFQIEFNLKGEKLNIDIINKGETVSIESLSEGERSRVNISTLLAIRKMMSEISSTKINILFLDEIMGVLDSEGKETIIEVLLKEQLNTFLVSHDYEHPLVPSITVIKENEESRLE